MVYTRRTRYGFKKRPYGRRRLMNVTKVIKDSANLQLGNAVADALQTSAATKIQSRFRGRSTRLKQTGARTRSYKKQPYKGKTTPYKFSKTKYSKMYGNRRNNFGKNRLIGLNQGHRHKFKQHITGLIVPPRDIKGIIKFPLKKYQLSELKYYLHPIQQKILLFGNQPVLTGSDNVLSDKVDYEDFVTTNDKNLIATCYYPITGPANFTGIQSFTRMQVDANSEGFSKVSVLGRQNRCDNHHKLDQTSASTITTSINNFKAKPDCILSGCYLRVQAQANRNYPVLITCQLVRMSNPQDVVSNQGVTSDELVELANNMKYIDYDTAEIIFQQSKVLQPCRSEKLVNQSFDLGWNGYYKLTKAFKDETALTVKADQGGTYKYGQQGKAKIAGSFLSQNNLSNRLVVLIKCKRLGNTQIGMATQTKEFVEVGITKTIGVNQPYNQEDGDAYMSNVTGHANVLPTDNYIGDELTSASFRCKAELTLNYRVKEGVRNIPIYINSASNNGQTQILHASPYDSNYGTLNATLNVTD